MGPPDPGEVLRDTAGRLTQLSGELTQLKVDANHWLDGPEYEALKHRLEDAHSDAEAALVEARRRVRLSEER